MKNNNKIESFKKNSSFYALKEDEQRFLNARFREFKFSFQQMKIIVDIAIDFYMWQERGIQEIWNSEVKRKEKIDSDNLFRFLVKKWEELKHSKKSYTAFETLQNKPAVLEFRDAPASSKILGSCPVASVKTRCCNLLTLDAVRNCGLDCSYCTIQSYFHDDSIYIEKELKRKIDCIKFDPEQIYHIGTGQSSDSLLWGNREGILDDLIELCEKNKNIILELKTKTDNIDYLLEKEIPRNLICTWTLNSKTIIENEEHHTASLEERINAARRVADKGALVGFHFHPMVYYDNFEREYQKVFDLIMETFSKDEVVMISFGTLTFIRPVVKKIRKRKIYSKILQMPLVDSEGKLSYPRDIKLQLFKFAYDCFEKWHDSVFFYMCMENIDLWYPVFNREYTDNLEFEKHMKEEYMKKIMMIF